MEIIKTLLTDVIVLKPKVFGDSRGFFQESYSLRSFPLKEIAPFVQDNHSYSALPGTIRGLHFQIPPFSQAKLVRVVKGAIWDVVVDLRPNSPTFGQYASVELTDENHLQLYIPHGFAHGFLVLPTGSGAHVTYKVDAFYSHPHSRGIRYDDPTLNIDWPLDPHFPPILSDQDLSWPFSFPTII